MSKGPRWTFYVLLFWLVFNVSLASWWIIFGLRQIDHIRQLETTAAQQLERQQRMLVMEGAILILSVIGGGVALHWYQREENRRHAQVRDFFASFTHDLKTSLASLRLQAESLQEDTKGSPVLDRLVADSVRLQLQLENSLFLANLERGRLNSEAATLDQILRPLKHHWPDLKWQVDGDARLHGDVRALSSVFSNLVQNAIVHGGANQVRLHVHSDRKRICVDVEDNGTGFSGDLKKLGEMYSRPSRTSGTGLGLYLSRRLLERQGGSLVFERGTGQGLKARVLIPGEMLT